jgi:hypothetical protein
MRFFRKLMNCNSMDKIEWFNLVLKVGTGMTESEQEISIKTLTNGIAHSRLLFMNSVM